MARVTLPEPSVDLAQCPHCEAKVKIDQHWYAPLQQIARGIISDVGDDYVRLANGIQVAMGTYTSSDGGGGTAVTFPVEFNSAPRVVATPIDDDMTSARFTVVGGITSAGFNAQTYKDDGTASAVGGNYLAVGKWSP